MTFSPEQVGLPCKRRRPLSLVAPADVI